MKDFDMKTEFNRVLQDRYPDGLDWELVGVLTKRQEVFTLSYDSKILSGVFEILCEPIVRKMAEDNGMDFEKGVQNQYPEFTIYSDPKHKIAIDIKTTYRQFNKSGTLKPFSFTLGSYRSYLRNPTKGIKYDYRDYAKHWIVGFIYSRNEKCDQTQIRQIIESHNLEAPFYDIEYSIQEKWKIAGKKPGSGNTTNIGSIKSANIEYFAAGKGAFQSKKDFETYWKNYG